MNRLTLEGHQGTSVEIDLCGACRAIWFDQFESLRLAPGSVLELFSIMAQHGTSAPARQRRPTCPRCGRLLVDTHDRQIHTTFDYWRCDAEHGRFITFVNFLREKDFIRPLTAEQIAELKASAQTINCGNCGAPVDLTRDSVCAHCGSPLSILDMKQMQATIAQLQAAAAPKPFDPTLPWRLALERRHTDRSLLDEGLLAISDWLKGPTG